MAHFLRDQKITNLSVTEDNLTQISSTFADRAVVLNANIPENDATGKRAILSYVVRFDDKGYRVFSVDALLRHFRQATTVERVLFTVETGESLRSSRQTGAFMELRLDEKDPNTCFLSVTSDDNDWVDASFSAVQDTLIWLAAVNRARGILPFAAWWRGSNPTGDAAGTAVATVDQADIRALDSRKTVVRHGAASL